MTAINRSAMLVVGLILVLLVAGQAAAQIFGTKVNVGDPDLGLPLSLFTATPFGMGGTGTAPAPGGAQGCVWLSYWDIGSTPGIYDSEDVVYLQFGSATGAGVATKIVKANDIRMTAWGSHPAGSKVKPEDSDIGQQVHPNPVFPGWAQFPSAGGTGFYFMNVEDGPAYNLGDPVYLKAGGVTPGITDTNDIRITPISNFPAGSRMSLSDPDAARPLTPFFIKPALPGPAAGPAATTGIAGSPIAQMAFFNANGNIHSPPPGLPAPVGAAIYDYPDWVYFDVVPLGVVSPNDVRLCEIP